MEALIDMIFELLLFYKTKCIATFCLGMCAKGLEAGRASLHLLFWWNFLQLFLVLVSIQVPTFFASRSPIGGVGDQVTSAATQPTLNISAEAPPLLWDVIGAHFAAGSMSIDQWQWCC